MDDKDKDNMDSGDAGIDNKSDKTKIPRQITSHQVNVRPIPKEQEK